MLLTVFIYVWFLSNMEHCNQSFISARLENDDLKVELRLVPFNLNAFACNF